MDRKPLYNNKYFLLDVKICFCFEVINKYIFTGSFTDAIITEQSIINLR